MTLRQIRIVVGVLIWVCAISWVGIKYVPAWFGEESVAGASLSTFMFEPPQTRSLRFKHHSRIRVGDPIFSRNSDGKLIQIGALQQVESPESQEYGTKFCDWASATFFSSSPMIEKDDYLTFHETPKSMDWVARFLFPADRRKHIARLVTEVYTKHSDEVLAELMPILQSAWKETSIIIRDELLVSLARHEPEFEKLAARFESEIVDVELIPLISDEVWPIVREQSRPVLEDVGQQIWQRASVFRFGWRALYDASPFPQRDLTQAEFARFVDTEALPVISRNLPRFIATQQAILEQIVSNPEVQQVVKDSLQKISEDPEVQRVLLQVLRESILENEKLQDALFEIWNRPDLQEVMSLTDQRLEPTIVEIGERVFGSPYTGVTPEFARILRNKILLKDDRWFILHKRDNQFMLDPMVTANDDPDTIVVLWGDSSMENPFYYPAKKR